MTGARAVAQLFDDAHRRAWIEAASKDSACDRGEAIAKATALVALLDEPKRPNRSLDRGRRAGGQGRSITSSAVKAGDRVWPLGGHRPGTIEMVDGDDAGVRCDCGHRGRYGLDQLHPIASNTPIASGAVYYPNLGHVDAASNVDFASFLQTYAPRGIEPLVDSLGRKIGPFHARVAVARAFFDLGRLWERLRRRRAGPR